MYKDLEVSPKVFIMASKAGKVHAGPADLGQVMEVFWNYAEQVSTLS